MENRYKGEVVSKTASRGSKSERKAVQIVTEAGSEYILRRKGGHPFKDAVLEGLVGKQIEAQGKLRGRTLFLDEWEEKDPPEAECENVEAQAAEAEAAVEGEEAAVDDEVASEADTPSP